MWYFHLTRPGVYDATVIAGSPKCHKGMVQTTPYEYQNKHAVEQHRLREVGECNTNPTSSPFGSKLSEAVNETIDLLERRIASLAVTAIMNVYAPVRGQKP
eukprot:4435742-Pyramimonas_sp.AAC.1